VGSVVGSVGSVSGAVGSVTAAVTLPSIPAGWITAAGIGIGALNGKGDWLLASSYTAPTNLTAAQIATGVWTDTMAGDFTVVNSIGKSVMNGVSLGTGLKVNSLTNLPAIPNNWLTAAGIANGALNSKGDWLLASSAPSNFSALLISGTGHISNVDTLTTYTGNTVQTGDSFSRIGATGSGLTSLAPASTALSTANWTNARAGYLDNLNVGGKVASHADILAINQSASKHLLVVTVGQYEPGETYTVEVRTFSASDGTAVDADSTPTLTATGQVSGNLSANLSAATHPATGVYRWTYTPGASPTLEQIRMDASATINSATFTLSAYTQTVDEATAVFTATDQAHLTSIYNKLPTNGIADETLVIAAIGTPAQAGTALSTANWPNSLATNLTTLAGHDPGGTLATSANQTAIINDVTAIPTNPLLTNDARLNHLDADVSSRMATFALPAHFSALLISAAGHISVIDAYTGDTPQTGDSYARLGAPAGASIAADIAAIPAADAAAICTAWQNLTLANGKTYKLAVELLVSSAGAGLVTGATAGTPGIWVLSDTSGAELLDVTNDGIGDRSLVTWKQ
jgi:hypothetical protein